MEHGKINLIKAILGESPATEPPDEVIEQLISSLNNEWQQQVIHAHFGIAEPKKTLVQIAKDLAVTRQRVWQIEEDALDRLRRPKEKTQLKEYTFSWQEKWALLEKDLRSHWGISDPIPTEQDSSVIDAFCKQHNLSVFDVYKDWWSAIEKRKKWQSQKWRRDCQDKNATAIFP